MNTRPKILAVDDRPENLVAIEKVLQDLEVEVIKAGSGNEALKATLHHDFILALLDVQMPEMDGYELAGILREEEKTNRLPFIFISAVYTDNLNVFKGYEKGAFSFITKPFKAEILINKVKFFMEKHQQEIELQMKNAELVAINHELEAFSYSISHDLRAPLRALSAYSKMLEEDFSDKLDEEGRRLLDNIHQHAQKMGTLVDDLLEFSRLGRKAPKKSRVDMNETVQTVLGEVSHAYPHHAEVTVNPLEPGHADQGLITQVWFNLVSNAIKYSSKREHPRVEIGCSRGDEETIYYVKDNGAGFDMKYAGKLFGVFQRLHNPKEFSGTGIGLAIVQRIVNKHGGRIWCEAAVDRGASFYFTLPSDSR
jgi:two-component system, sensor histidine kinase and response regulator